jgi:PBSX family phage terminase large subunit
VSPIRSDNTATLFGEKVYCLGADNVRQVNRIRGASVIYCYGDEVTTWNEEVFTMLKSRLDKPDSIFDGTCNPEGPNHWFKRFIDSGADVYAQAYTIDDNPFLPAPFVAALKQEYSGTVFYDRYIRGLWVHAEGLIYPDAADGKCIVSFDHDRRYIQYAISMDYGTLNPCSMGLWGLSDGVWYRINEYYHDGRSTHKQLTDEEYYTELENLAGDLPITAVVIDPSAASFITLVRRRNRFRVRHANNAVLDGIRATAAAMQTGKVKICDNCVNTIAEFAAYRWDEESSEDKPIKEHDHAMDDLRYFVMTMVHKNNAGFVTARL